MVREVSCDVLVAGAGPAGLAAADAAAERGVRVVLIESDAFAGGRIFRPDGGCSPEPAVRGAERCDRKGVVRIHGATLFDARSPHLLFAASDEGPVLLRAKSVILATGARERWIPFPGATDPRVTGAGGLQALVKGGFDVRGRRVIVAGTGPLLWPVAARLRSGGARIVALLEQVSRRTAATFAARRPSIWGQALGLSIRLRGVSKRFGSHVVGVRPRTDGALDVDVATSGRPAITLVCDRLAVGYGLEPETRIAELLGCRIEAGAVVVDDSQRTSVADVFAAGEIAGVGGLGKARAEGRLAGVVAAGGRPDAGMLRAVRRARAFADSISATFALGPGPREAARPEVVLCRCEDATLAAFDACSDARAAKLLARVGMGACQGRLCGDALSYLRGRTPPSVRPPIFPVPLGLLAATWEAAATETSADFRGDDGAAP